MTPNEKTLLYAALIYILANGLFFYWFTCIRSRPKLIDFSTEFCNKRALAYHEFASELLAKATYLETQASQDPNMAARFAAMANAADFRRQANEMRKHAELWESRESGEEI